MNHLVIIGAVWPEPNSTAAGSRMLQLMALFQKQDYDITFLCSAMPSDFSFDLSTISVKTQAIQLNDSSFDTLIKELNPDVVLFDRFMIEEQYGWRVMENCPNALRILDTEDLHFLRKSREIAFKQNRELVFEDYISDTFKREMASMYRCDLTLLISEYEMQLATETFKIDASLLYYLPFLSEEINPNVPKFEERNHFVSIGNFLHEPNWQTVLQLKKHWKFIKKQLPDAELHVYGAYVSEKAKQLHNEKEGFLIKGRAKSVAEVYSKARVLLAPIPYGAGLKGKLFEAMQLGLPSVTTKMGAEGMNGVLDWNGFISDEDDFVAKTVELYTNKSLWETAQKNGYEIIEKRFKKELFESDFMNQVANLQENLKTHRNQNFFGQILQHQSLQSTKYMSKWIEAKNSWQSQLTVAEYLKTETETAYFHPWDEDDFVEKAINLYTNKSLWETTQKNGYEIIEKRFKKELFATDFMNRIEEIKMDLKRHRNQNFFGQILQHQSLQSTKYMSKWIEAKNS